MSALLGPFAVMFGMMLVLYPLTGDTMRLDWGRVRAVGERLRKHYPATRNDGAFDDLIDELHGGEDA